MPTSEGWFRRLFYWIAESSWFQTAAYACFAFLYRKRTAKYITQLAVTYLLGWATYYVVSQHQLPENPSLSFSLRWLLPGMVAVVGLFMVELPISVLGRFERKGQRGDEAVAVRLMGLLQEIENTAPETVDGAFDTLLAVVGRARDGIYFATPYAMYVLADRWEAEFQHHIKSQEVSKRIARLAKRSAEFRTVLQEFEGPLHWVLPDPDSVNIKVQLEKREARIGVADGSLRKLNRMTVEWVYKLRSHRRKNSLKTHVRLTRCLPDFRLMSTDTDCVHQVFPADSYGLLEPVRHFEVADHSAVHGAIRMGLIFWCRGEGN